MFNKILMSEHGGRSLFQTLGTHSLPNFVHFPLRVTCCTAPDTPHPCEIAQENLLSDISGKIKFLLNKTRLFNKNDISTAAFHIFSGWWAEAPRWDSAIGAAIWLRVRGQRRWQLLDARHSCRNRRPKQEK